MPDTRPEAFVVVAAEPAPVFLVAKQIVAFQRILEMKRRLTRAEFLEYDEIHAVGVKVETIGQCLPAEVRIENRIYRRGQLADCARQKTIGLDVHQRDQGGLQRRAQKPHALAEKQ